MRIAVLIMSGDQEPSLRNVEALKETMVKKSVNNNLVNTYDFFTYSYKNSDKPIDTILDLYKHKKGRVEELKKELLEEKEKNKKVITYIKEKQKIQYKYALSQIECDKILELLEEE